MGALKILDFPVTALLDRYCFFRQRYVMMKNNMTIRIDNAYSARQVWEHLNGNMGLCVFAGPSNTTFLTVDVDLKAHSVVRKVVATMVDLGFPEDRIYVSDSGNKGYHVDVFFEHSIYNWMAKELYELIIYFGQFNPRKIEYRPTAKNAIKLPLGVHQKTGRRCWFVDLRSMNPIEDMTYIERTEKIPVEAVERILRDGNKRRYNLLLDEIQNRPSSERLSARAGKKDTGAASIRIEERGTRQRRMVEEALRLYRNGGNYSSIHDDLVSWLTNQDPAMYKDSFEECMRNIDNITAWVMQKGRRCELGDDPNHNYHKSTRIYETDVARILQGSTKAVRLLAFFITVFCDRYEFCGLGEHKLREATGIKSHVTIVKAANELVEKGLFYKIKGGYRNIGNSLRPVTNKYKFVTGYERGGDYVEIDELIDAGNIYGLYIRAIAALCDDGQQIGHLTANEIADIRKAKEGYGEN